MQSMALTNVPAEPADERLVECARGGDRQAFAILAARYRNVAFAYAMARLGNRDEAEDAVQEALVKAFQSLGRFRLSGSWAPWLMRILRNQCHDALRRRQVRKQHPLDPDLADCGPTPELLAVHRDAEQRMVLAVGLLPEKYRTPLLMHYSAARAYKEIALALDVPVSAVVGRLAGAMRILRRKLLEEP